MEGNEEGTNFSNLKKNVFIEMRGCIEPSRTCLSSRLLTTRLEQQLMMMLFLLFSLVLCIAYANQSTTSSATYFQ